MWEAGPSDVEQRVEVEGDRAVPVVGRRLGHGTAGAAAGVGDHDVELTVHLDDLADGPTDGVLVRGIDLECPDAVAMNGVLRGEEVESALVDVCHGDDRASARSPAEIAPPMPDAPPVTRATFRWNRVSELVMRASFDWWIEKYVERGARRLVPGAPV